MPDSCYPRVSIHAPTRGATVNFRQIVRVRNVSIHAPTRGATVAIIAFAWNLSVSIHAPTRGATDNRRANLFVVIEFQSTHPHGVRLSMFRISFRPILGFNPRTHTGCDFVAVPVFTSIHVSIHAPTRGATKDNPPPFCFIVVSIHAPTRGATPLYLIYIYHCLVSIHAPTRGATLR